MKTRKTIPKATREKVLAEYSHHCAICGGPNPQLHHIDEDPSNNDPLNLLPLCPTDHLTDQHNPTRKHGPDKLALFREYKDPSILKPQFQAIFDRVSFLYHFDDLHGQSALQADMDDLLAFINGMEMGEYYKNRLKPLLRTCAITVTDASLLIDFVLPSGISEQEKEKRHYDRRKREHAQTRQWAEDQRALLPFIEDEILKLIVEMLRFQKW